MIRQIAWWLREKTLLSGRRFEFQYGTIFIELFFYFIGFLLLFVLISYSKIFQNAPKSN